MNHDVRTNRLYGIYMHMKNRCYCKTSDSFKNYGAKGIGICKEWMVYEVFQLWALDNGYSETLTIDRIDNNRGYSPDNCRWATRCEQNQNKRTGKEKYINGLSYKEHCIKYNIRYRSFLYLINKGVSLQEVMNRLTEQRGECIDL